MQLPAGIIRTKEGHYVLESDSHLSRWVENHGRLDVSDGQIEFYKDYIKSDSVCLDGGACIGDYTATLEKLVGPMGRVMALEPNPLAFEALRLNFANGATVRCLNAGLSDVSGEARMVVEKNAGASYVGVAGVPVTLTTIDALGFNRLDFVHLDCEGFESRALLGGSATLARCHPVIVLEINHGCLARIGLKEEDVLGALRDLGYRWAEIEPHLNSSYPQRDIICFPK